MASRIWTFTWSGQIRAPFLQTGQEIAEYGMDRSALRNHKGEIILSGRQIQGNLRHLVKALFGKKKDTEIVGLDLNIVDDCGGTHLSAEEFAAFFGKEKHDAPSAGLKFFDAILGTEPEAGLAVKPITKIGQTVTRSAQDDLGGGVGDGLVFTSEVHFLPEEVICFQGTGYLLAQDADQAGRFIRLSRWLGAQIPLLGADKTAGFGRMTDFSIREPTEQTYWAIATAGSSRRYRLTLTSEHPLLISPRNRSGNVMESLDYISGNVLFGAIADWLCLNGKFGEFADCLEHVRVLHCYPAASGSEDRPQPTTFMETEMAEVPVGLNLHRDAWRNNPVSNDGLAYLPERYLRTRTAVTQGDLTPKDEKLFTMSALSPVGTKWIGGIEWTGEEAPSATFQELIAALSSGLPRLGKTAAPVALRLAPVADLPEINDATVLTLRLVSDAWITDVEVDETGWMREAYRAFFCTHLGSDVTLEDFAARQSWRRTPRKREKGPWHITLAGSVFKLSSIDDTARAGIKSLLRTGLPCHNPKITHGDCPFVPENGYGEFVVEI